MKLFAGSDSIEFAINLFPIHLDSQNEDFQKNKISWVAAPTALEREQKWLHPEVLKHSGDDWRAMNCRHERRSRDGRFNQKCFQVESWRHAPCDEH